MKRSLLAIAVLLSACGGNTQPPPPGVALKSKESRITQAPPQSDITTIITSNQDFGLDLMHRLAPEGNALIAPHSIQLAFGMLYAGANADTKTAIEKTFHLPVGTSAYHPVMNHLDQQFAEIAQNGKARDGSQMKLDVQDQLFTQKGFHVEQAYLDTLAKFYGAGVNQLDFEHQAESSRTAINDWVSTATQQKITELFPQGAIDSSTRLTLVNTIYMDAGWAHAFKESDTEDKPFHLASGTDVTVKMMRQALVPGSYAKDGDVVIAELPYSGDQLALTVVMPAKLSDLEPIDAAKLQGWFGQLHAEKLDLGMPRMKLEEKYTLDDALKAMGMSIAYSDQADFSGISGDKSLSVQTAVHKTYADIAEKGTEAAAATGIGVGTTSIEVGQEVTLDHPFLFFIRDTKSGEILFLGRFTGP